MALEGKTLYEVLGIHQAASQVDIKKAYIKMALKLHPDKNPDNEEAKANFQTLQRIYGILRDPAKRKRYDQTGSVEDTEALTGDQFDSLYDYYRNIYKKVSEDEINEIEMQYRGSEEEKQDVLKYYSQLKGNMDQVFEWVICSDSKRDSHRFLDILEQAISRKEVKRYKEFSWWAKDVKKRHRPRSPLAVKEKTNSQKSGLTGEGALIAAIRSRSKHTETGLMALGEKYGVAPSGTDKEPTEEEFEAAAARLAQKRTDAKEKLELQPRRMKKPRTK